MSSQAKKSGSIAIAVAAIFFMGFFLSYIVRNGETLTISKALEKEKLNSERMLSEKLEHEKRALQFESSNQQLEKQNKDHVFTIDSLIKKLKGQQSLIADAIKKSKLFVSLKNQVSDAEIKNKSQEERIKDLVAENNSLRNSQSELNNTIASLTDENKGLKENNELMNSLLANNVLVEALKGKKDKLTIKAKRTNKLQATFDLPQSVSENLSFTVTGPNGKVYHNNEKNVITWSYVPVNDKNSLIASTKNMASESNSFKRVKLIFRPTEKLKKGIYTIEVMNTGTKKVSKIQVRLK